jgi:hypothetical protein
MTRHGREVGHHEPAAAEATKQAVRKKNPQTTVMKARRDIEGNQTPAHRKELVEK